jgi:hypothetical protein
LTLFHAGDIADRRSRLQPINQLVLGADLAIFMMIITSICSTRKNFKKFKFVSKICLIFKKILGNTQNILEKLLFFGKIAILNM